MKIKHVDYALVAKSHPSMYLMHKYWARKPHNVVSEYIEHYSKKDEIVLDPFGGSGVTAIESIKLGRKAISIDLDPMSIFITRMTSIPIDLEKFKLEFDNLEKKIKPKIDELFKTKCKKCKNEVVSEAIIWENNKPEQIRYSCNCSKGRLWKDLDKNDLNILKNIPKPDDMPFWFPKNELIWNTRVNVHEGTKVYELFTNRNLLSLSIILNEIEKIKDKDIKDIMKFTFSSSLPQASKMVFVIRRRGRTSGKVKESKPEVGSWATRGYWVPDEFFEVNAWNCFEQRFLKILRGKEESNSLIKNFKEAKNFNDIKNNSNIFLKVHNTTEIDEVIPPNSVDYIFTDPPYGDAVPYLELNYMWSSWMKFTPDFEDEIIISDSPVRNKKEEIYERLLKSAFRQLFKVLKPGKWMTVTFHNTNIKVWNSIIHACSYAGFDLEKIVYQTPARASAKGLLAPYGSAVGDYYLRFKKPKTMKLKTRSEINELRYKKIVLESAKRIIAERGEPTPYAHILNGIIVELKKEGALLIGKQNPDEVMKEYLNKEFILIDSLNKKGKIIGKKWWFKNPKEIPYLELVPLTDRVEVSIVEVLRRKVKASFDDVLQEIFIKFPNALTPETQSIKDILDEYAVTTKDKKWMLKPEVKIRESEHSKMIYYLCLLGKKADFDVWVGLREQSDTYNDKRLSELITKKDPTFRFIPTINRDRIKQIDVLWHDEGRIKYEFEVENTTAITEAIVRGSNIPHENVSRIIVIPKERESLLSRKLKDPILKENINKYNWKFTFYDEIEKLFSKHRRKGEFDPRKIEKILKVPKMNNDVQNSIKTYFKK